jgi:hypothetical protein
MNETRVPIAKRLIIGTVKGRFSVLFWMLVAALAAPVVIPDGPILRRVLPVLVLFVMLAGLFAVSSHKRTFRVGLLLAVPALIMGIVAQLLDLRELSTIASFLYLVFLVHLALAILLHVLKLHQVDAEIIYGAVSVYLLMALVWAQAYYILALVEPGSHYPDRDEMAVVQERRAAGQTWDEPELQLDWRVAQDHAQGTMVYYSLVTLTTLGYGDIYPVKDAARILAMLEATLGQLYLVILVARLVGLYTAVEMERRRGRGPPGSRDA